MDEGLKAKLDEARERMNSQQAGINADRKHDDRATREWARGKTAAMSRESFRGGAKPPEGGTGSVEKLADR
jgi:hypothetical protein